jgi:hypothetical protein
LYHVVHSAVKREGYDVRWISPYEKHSSGSARTAFLVISRRVAGNVESEVDWLMEHGLSEHDLLSRKLHMERHDYNLTFLQRSVTLIITTTSPSFKGL